MQVTLYTKETAPHRPVVAVLRARDQFNLENWYRDHAAIDLLTDEEKAAPKSRGSWGAYVPPLELWPPCGACDWEQLRKNPTAAKERTEIKRRLRLFERTGKFPPRWLESAPPVKFGGIMSDKEASRVVLPRIPLSPTAGSDSYLSVYEKTLDRGQVTREYLDNVNRKGARVFATPEQDRDRRRVKAWRCGCRVTEREESVEKGWGKVWRFEAVEPCARHKGALEGREED